MPESQSDCSLRLTDSLSRYPRAGIRERTDVPLALPTSAEIGKCSIVFLIFVSFYKQELAALNPRCTIYSKHTSQTENIEQRLTRIVTMPHENEMT